MCTACLLFATAPVALTCDRGHPSLSPVKDVVTVIFPDLPVYPLEVALHIAWIVNPLPAQGAMMHGFLSHFWRK